MTFQAYSLNHTVPSSYRDWDKDLDGDYVSGPHSEPADSPFSDLGPVANMGVLSGIEYVVSDVLHAVRGR